MEKHRQSHEKSLAKPTAGTPSTITPLGSSFAGSTPPQHSTLFRQSGPNSTLNRINNTLPNMPEPSSSTSHCPEPASSAPTETAYDIRHIEQSGECMESLLAAGIKVRDFGYEPTPNASKAPEVFNPVPCPIAADCHMRNPYKNFGLLIPKSLFRLIKVGWLSLADVRLNVSTPRSRSTTTVPTSGATCSSSCPRTCRYRTPYSA